MQRISLSIPPYLLEKVKKRADQCGVSLSRWVCDLVAKEIEREPVSGEHQPEDLRA